MHSPTPTRSTPFLSSRVRDLHASPIREILSVIEQPGMISFAGGLPAAESFPALDLGALPPRSLQYGASEGDPELRAAIAQDVTASGLPCSAQQVLVLSGSQQGIDLMAKLFIDAGRPVWVEAPTYLAALQVFRFFGARLLAFDAPAAALPADDVPPAFAYLIPTFQNPTGRCYTASQRAALAARCDEAGVTVFEDDPYRDLAFADGERRPLCANLRSSCWVYQGSFSKSLAPGLRLGYLVATPELIGPLVRLKQAADLHSSRISQWLVLQQLRAPDRAQRQERIVALYRAKRDHFAQLLAQHLAGLAQWEIPQGGLFFWLRLHACIDTRSLLTAAIARGVAFMPGEHFFVDPGAARGMLRLNFSHASAAEARRGIEILAQLLATAAAEHRP